mmetsp:Transcript_8907/g.21855  ORF Transcript_8907/g.21855 Transcript_8907/m.21855 type:complete len:217 (-) Transcript_8907:811-1461(-)
MGGRRERWTTGSTCRSCHPPLIAPPPMFYPESPTPPWQTCGKAPSAAPPSLPSAPPQMTSLPRDARALRSGSFERCPMMHRARQASSVDSARLPNSCPTSPELQTTLPHSSHGVAMTACGGPGLGPSSRGSAHTRLQRRKKMSPPAAHGSSTPPPRPTLRRRCGRRRVYCGRLRPSSQTLSQRAASPDRRILPAACTHASPGTLPTSACSAAPPRR